MRLVEAFIALLCATVVPLVQLHLDRIRGDEGHGEGRLYLHTGEQVKRLCPGFEGVMGGVYWLRTVQYYGSQRAFSNTKRFEHLRPLIDITVTLDPRLELAYRYGAMFLAEAWPSGPGKPEEGLELLERGVKALPSSWRLRWDLGSFHYFYLRDPRGAADVLIEGARIPGAPFWLESLAASFLTKGGERAVARELWRRQYEQGVGIMKDNALLHIQMLDALSEAEYLTALVARIRKETGAYPPSLQELISTGQVKAFPRDPTGTPYEFDRTSGKVAIAQGSRLWRRNYEM